MYDTASEPAERKYPSSTWEEGWAGNTISKELRHPPRLGRGGRPATATLAKEDEGAESWDSAHHQLGQDVYDKEEWEGDDVLEMHTEDHSTPQEDEKIQRVMASVQALSSAVASLQLQATGARQPHRTAVQAKTPPLQAAAPGTNTKCLKVAYQGTLAGVAS